MDNDFYYSTVYSWFDKCGIISNIRMHLQQNLVNTLKSKESSLTQMLRPPRSVKQYVYDLLIAEYLWNHNYVYTLSVFTSEAPLPINFNQQSTSNTETDSRSREKLQNDYVQHTLESLGFEFKESKGHHIMLEYAKSDMPLLICILQCLRTFLFEETNHKKRSETSVQKMLCKDEQTQTEFDNKEHCYECKRLSIVKKKLFQQKEMFDMQLKEKERKLKEQALVTEQQLMLLQEKMEQAQNLLHSINVKKQHLTEEKKKEDQRIYQKELKLLKKEEFFLQEADRLGTKHGSYKQLEEDLKRLQDELIKVKKDLLNIGTKSDCNIRDVQVQTDFHSYTMDWSEKSLLNKEKQDLNSLVQEQQERIEQLTLRAVQLSRQLEEIQLIRLNGVQVQFPTVRFSNASTFISESSSTEDILQDAKIRLKRLEEESVKADKYYHDYISMSSQ